MPQPAKRRAQKKMTDRRTPLGPAAAAPIELNSNNIRLGGGGGGSDLSFEEKGETTATIHLL